jgi:protein phosphatase
LRREHNEDTYWADAELGLFLVADGMGGSGRGELAAAIARDALVDATRAGRALEPAIRGASDAIAKQASAASAASPMGATLAVLRLDAGQYQVASVGDNPVHLWQHGCLRRVHGGNAPETDTDRTGVDGAHAALAPPRHKRITQALGITPSEALYAEPVSGAVERGMQFLLCSDGLTEAVGETGIGAVLARTELAAQECVDHLLLAALDAGGRDNITVLLVRIV